LHPVAAGPTHYEVLGIAHDVEVDVVHRAYLDAARQSHPDRNAGSEAAGASMARINEAWRVLGHPGRRRQYDRELRGEPSYLGSTSTTTPGPSRSSALDPDVDDDLVDVAGGAGSALFSFLPWLVVLGVLAIIFVFTAYAATGGGQADADGEGSGSRLGECIVITSARPTIATIDCSVGNDGQVVEEIDPGLVCPAGTRTLEVPGEPKTLCLAG
jgi:curved DNA-binding protein CbpA